MTARLPQIFALTLTLALTSCGGGGVFGEDEPADSHEARCDFESKTVLCRNTAQGIQNYIAEYGPLPEEMDFISLGGVEQSEALSQLSGVRKAGSIHIRSLEGVKDLSFLRGLEEVGDFEIASNKSLRSLEGLENLEVVTYRMTISKNGNLESLEGLENLTRVGRVDEGDGFNIFSNTSLKNLEGLESFKEAFNLSVQSNNAMRTFGNLPSLELLGGMAVRFNDKLETLGTAPKLRDVVKGAIIEKNKLLSDCTARTYIESASEFDSEYRIENNLPNSSCEQLEK